MKSMFVKGCQAHISGSLLGIGGPQEYELDP